MKPLFRRSIALVAGCISTLVILLLVNSLLARLVRKGERFDFFEKHDPKNLRPLKVSPEKGLSPEMPPELPQGLQSHEPVKPPQPNIVHLHENGRYQFIVDGKTMKEFPIAVDGKGRRITPGQKEKKASRHLILLGDSQVFGFTLRDHETLGAVLSEMMPDYRVYNLGRILEYPGDTLQVTRQLTQEEVPENSGAAIYFFFDYHILRNMLSLSMLQLGGANKPRYHENASGLIVPGPSPFQENKHLTTAKLILGGTPLFKYFGLDERPEEEDLRFQAKMFVQMKEALKRIGTGSFIVVLMPDQTKGICRALIPYLEAAGIFYIDLSHWDSQKIVPGKARVDYDGHISAAFNKVVGKELARMLNSVLKTEDPASK